MKQHTEASTARNVVEQHVDQRMLVAWRDLACVIGLAVLPLLVFWQAATLRGVFFIHDIQYYFYPYHNVTASLLRQGELPLWNPYSFSGMPLLGDGQTAMFYPPNWLFFVLPGAAALNYALILQFSIAGVGAFLFARALNLSRAAALVAALAFMFCGFLTARVVHLSILSGAALVPWAFLGVDGALRPRTARWFALGALAIAIQAVSGHPQVPIYTALGLGLYALLRGAERWYLTGSWLALAFPMLRLVGMYLLGYAVAAIQLVPWVELGTLSPRAAGASFEFVFGNSMAASNWLLFLFPYLYGALGAGLFAATPLSVAGGSRLWEHSAYVGVVTLGLALVALLSLRLPQRVTATTRRQLDANAVRAQFTALFFALLLLCSVLMAAGKYTPLGQVIYALPVIGKLRDVERVIVLASFALAFLAGLGVQRLSAGGVRRGVVLAALIPLALVVGTLAAAHTPWFQTLMALKPDEVANLALARPNAWVPLVLATLGAAWLIGWGRMRRPMVGAGFAVLLVAVDIGLCYAMPFNPVDQPDLFAQVPDVVQFLRRDPGPFRVAMYLANNQLPNVEARESLAVSWAMNYGIEDINGFNSLQPRRYTDYLYGPQVEDVSYGYLNDPARFQPADPTLSSLNVKYVLVPVWDSPPLGAHLRLVYNNAYVRVYENTLVGPRAFFADSVQVERDQRAVLHAVKAPQFTGRAALVEDASFPALLPASGLAEVQITARTAAQLAMQTQTDAPRLLVLSEMYTPGWRASVDGVETPIYRTNYLFRGVVVPAGAHHVTVAYQPRSALIGAGVTALALVLVLVLLARR